MKESMENKISPLLWRGSMPKGGRWYNIKDRIDKFIGVGYLVHVIVMVRELFAMSQSQIEKHMPHNNQDAFGVVQQAYRTLFAGLAISPAPFVLVSYESLVHQLDGTLIGLSQFLNMQLISEVEITDENLKRYGGTHGRKGS
jgi:hypothetical protein